MRGKRTPQHVKLTVQGTVVDVIFKPIKNINISVRPPAGMVRVSAPFHVGLEGVREAIQGRWAWIQAHQQEMQSSGQCADYQYITGEMHLVWGQRVPLRITYAQRSRAQFDGQELTLSTPHNADLSTRKTVLDRWYRQESERVIPPFVAQWQPVIGQLVHRIAYRRMKTKWGTCQPQTGVLRFNTELAKYDPMCLEYVVVHELVHLLEGSHNARFKSLMATFLPDWQERKRMLNDAARSELCT
ncbi:SprT family zinc-dependent metalloprotease [Stomatohabitans albus]|uniref:M48 family metallopeptidase n=1 Tax=Stomatohabitans albus TaxID=3110766 RepID=UPI00300D1B24